MASQDEPVSLRKQDSHVEEAGVEPARAINLTDTMARCRHQSACSPKKGASRAITENTRGMPLALRIKRSWFMSAAAIKRTRRQTLTVPHPDTFRKLSAGLPPNDPSVLTM